MAFAGALLLAGCGGGEQEPQKFVGVATGGTGGVYYAYGGGIATLINRHIPYLRASTEVTGASVENIFMIAEETAEIATIMNDVGYQAYYGEGRFSGDPQPIRTMFQMYPHHFQLVVLAGSGINSVEDITGRRVSVGAPGSGTEYQTDLIFGSLGLSYEEMTVFRLPFAETGADLKDRRIDAGIWSVAAPTSSIMEITATQSIRLISFSEEEMEQILSDHPYYSRNELAAGTYPGQDQPVINPGVWNSVVCHADYPEQYVYDIVKAVFEHQSHLVSIHHFAEYSTPANTIEHSVLPLHPGAVRYLRDAGFEVPSHLIPPEMQD